MSAKMNLHYSLIPNGPFGRTLRWWVIKQTREVGRMRTGPTRLRKWRGSTIWYSSIKLGRPYRTQRFKIFSSQMPATISNNSVMTQVNIKLVQSRCSRLELDQSGRIQRTRKVASLELSFKTSNKIMNCNNFGKVLSLILSQATSLMLMMALLESVSFRNKDKVPSVSSDTNFGYWTMMRTVKSTKQSKVILEQEFRGIYWRTLNLLSPQSSGKITPISDSKVTWEAHKYMINIVYNSYYNIKMNIWYVALELF